MPFLTPCPTMALGKNRKEPSMPSGVYKRGVLSEAQKEMMRVNLAKGREKAARKRAAETLREIAQDPEWREKVSIATTKAMYKPEVRKKHLKALQKNRKKYGSVFSGGNGAKPTDIIKHLMWIYEPLGFIREYAIKTKGHNTEHTPPNSYKVDFGNPEEKVAIEVDGPYHTKRRQKELDTKKQEVLEALGWRVLRVEHS